MHFTKDIVQAVEKLHPVLHRCLVERIKWAVPLGKAWLINHCSLELVPLLARQPPAEPGAARFGGAARLYPETDEAIVEDVLNAPPVTLASNEPDSTIELAGWVEALVRTGRDDLAIKVFDRISGVEGRVVAMSAAADQLRSLNRIELADRILVHRFRETNRVPRIHFYRHGL